MNVNPVTAQVSAVSDPLPQIIEGIPLRTRRIQVNLDRPDFALNPTNCNPSQVAATIYANEGAAAQRSAPFQVANCAALGFGPKIGIKVLGPMKRLGHPRLRAILRPGAGEANLASTSAALPHSEFLDSSHIRTVCTRADYAAKQCPADSIYGYATAYTPILDQPLSGPVYLRSSGKPLPDLVLALHGQVDVEASAHIDSDKNQGIRTTFSFLPDVPLSKVILNMQGGAKGLIQNSKNLCKGAGKVTVSIGGQNGASLDFKTKLQSTCKKKRRHKRSHKRHSRPAVLSARKVG